MIIVGVVVILGFLFIPALIDLGRPMYDVLRNPGFGKSLERVTRRGVCVGLIIVAAGIVWHLH